jgi:DNA-binding NarL/FixJ family response regulator
MAIRVFLADDHTVVREGLRSLLETETQGDIIVVGDATNGRQAVEQVRKLRPNVVIMDIAMPALNGIEATEQVSESCPSTKVVILSMYSSVEHISRALKAGAKGYVIKESAGKELVEAVRSVHAGRLYLSQKIAETTINDYVHLCQAVPIKTPLESLTLREREVLQLVAEGKSSTEIADVIYLSKKTVETYRSRLMQKLGVSNLVDLLRFAIQHGLTPE